MRDRISGKFYGCLFVWERVVPCGGSLLLLLEGRYYPVFYGGRLIFRGEYWLPFLVLVRTDVCLSSPYVGREECSTVGMSTYQDHVGFRTKCPGRQLVWDPNRDFYGYGPGASTYVKTESFHGGGFVWLD